MAVRRKSAASSVKASGAVYISLHPLKRGIMSIDENKEIVRRLINILNSGDLSRMNEVCDEDMVYRIGAGDEYPGLDNYRQAIEASYEGFPDMELSIEELMAEGAKVHMVYRITGTHSGEYLGIPPSDRSIVHQASSLITVEDGKVVEQVDYYDWLEFLKQLGAVSGEVNPGGEDWPSGGATLRAQ